jgi:hypothetical protein
MWCPGGRVVDTDRAVVQREAVQLLDASLGILNASHGDEAESSGSVALEQD